MARTDRCHRASVGLLYLGARWYDPDLGRFLSVDPASYTPASYESFNRYAYANNNPYRFVDPNGRSAVTAIGGLMYETGQWVQGNGFDGQSVLGALADGYNGEGDGFAAAAVVDATSLVPGGVAVKAISALRGLRIASQAAGVAKIEVNAAREAAKEQFRKEAAGLETKVIRSGRDGAGKVVGVGTTTRKGPTYRPKDDGSYSVGRPGKVQHFRPDGQGGHTVDQP